MTEDFLSSRMFVDDPRAGAVFSNSTLRRIVLALVQNPRSLSDLSAESGMELKRLHHHVGRLCRLGLVAVVASRRRAGRAIKLYAATHSQFFVPHGLAAEPTTGGLARELRATLAEEADRSGTGVLFSTGRNGEPLARIVRDSEAGEPPLELWRLLRLTPAEARAMSDALREVVDRHCALSGGRGKPYLLHTALVRRSAATFSVDNAPRA